MTGKKKPVKTTETKVVKVAPKKKEVTESKSKKVAQAVKIPKDKRVRTAEGIKRDMKAKAKTGSPKAK